MRYINRMSDAAQGTVFEAVIIPHRSLSPRGLRLLVGAILLASCTITTLFCWLGAWPIIGFNGGEILLAIALIRANARAARASEVLLLSGDGFHVIRTDRHGQRNEVLLPAAWLNVVLEENPGRIPRLLLATRGIGEEVGRSLGEEEKRSLAAALHTALYDWRHPRFDNPQLR